MGKKTFGFFLIKSWKTKGNGEEKGSHILLCRTFFITESPAMDSLTHPPHTPTLFLPSDKVTGELLKRKNERELVNWNICR